MDWIHTPLHQTTHNTKLNSRYLCDISQKASKKKRHVETETATTYERVDSVNDSPLKPLIMKIKHLTLTKLNPVILLKRRI